MTYNVSSGTLNSTIPIPIPSVANCTDGGSRDVRNRIEMCGIDFLNFGSVFEKNSDSVQNEFGSVRFQETRFGSDIIVTYYSCNS